MLGHDVCCHKATIPKVKEGGILNENNHLMRHPPGRLSTTMGVNANAACPCGHERFYLMVRMMANGENQLMTVQCAQCRKESLVPLADQIKGRKFQA